MTLERSSSQNFLERECALLDQRRKTLLDSNRPYATASQHARANLTARERIALLFDEGTFVELAPLGHHQNENDLLQGLSEEATAGDGIVVGFGQVRGRTVCCAAYDFTVLGGSMGTVNDAKMSRVRKMALEYGYPLVFFLEGGGGRVQERMGAKAARGHDRFYDLTVMSGWVPIVGAVMGPCFAGHANLAACSDYVLMRKGASMGMAGPRLVEAAIGEKSTPEQLGGSRLHTTITGMADEEFDSEEALITRIKDFLSFLPDNAQHYPPERSHNQSLTMPDSILRSIPDSSYQSYDMREVINLIVDRDFFFELKPAFARNIITAFAYINGYPVGVIASNPAVLAGMLDSNASDKIAHFISLCDAFNVPLLYLVDVPGYMVGAKTERSGIVRHAMKPLYELGQATVPRLTVIIRKAYGLAYHAMGAAEFDPDLLVAWPCAEISSMGPEGAVNIIHGKQINDSPDATALKQQQVAYFRELTRPLHAAEEVRIDDVIDPRETRSLLANVLATVWRQPRITRAHPPKKHGISPI